MNLEKLYHKFVNNFWNNQCCPYPCINHQDSDDDYLQGAEDFYEFIKKGEKYGDRT